MRTGSPIITHEMLSFLGYAYGRGGGDKGEEEKVKKPAFFFLGGITEEQVKHKVFML